MASCGVGNAQTRHILCFMFVAGFIFIFMVRVNLNLTIVGMVKPITNLNGTQELLDRGNSSTNTSEYNENIQGEFEWNEFQQGLILGSFFYGYMTSQIPGGRISEIYGMKPVFGLSVLLNGLLAICIPFCARIHWILLFIIRILQGLAQGVTFPALSASVAKWVPINERARFLALTAQGCSVGPVIALPLCGWILTTWGWPAVFYITGSMAVAFYGLWQYFVYNTPQEHPRISPEEKKYLEDNLQESHTNELVPFPWKEAMTSAQFWLGAAAHVGSDWGFHTFYTYGPKYIKDALQFDISQSAILSSLPFLCQYISATLVGILADKLVMNYNVSIRHVRKVSVFFSHCMPGMLVIVLTLIGDYVNLSVVVLTLAVTMLGFLSTGHYQNPIDIAPNFAGSLTGVANSLGSLGGILCTTIAGTSLQNYGSPKGWHVTFYVAASVYAATSIPFIIWAESKELPWNNPTKENVELKIMAREENDVDAETKLLDKTQHNS
ncbi:hypothetical protein RUM43_013736 [Polyplax serrata]|uniref:Major facilitator superfamily (MFS) profile domain-containing protein n=1 Tax=Polyplax serrata TaxID=468196 RepID=A0AAN8PH78_POLSC